MPIFIADHYNVKLTELKAKNNSKAIAGPRQIAMYLTKALTGASLPEIGKGFGGKHHSTVIQRGGTGSWSFHTH